MAARKQVTQVQLGNWVTASRAEKSVILDAVCHVTGCIVTMPARRSEWSWPTRPGAAGHHARSGTPVRTHDDDAVALLTRCWASWTARPDCCQAPEDPDPGGQPAHGAQAGRGAQATRAQAAQRKGPAA